MKKITPLPWDFRPQPGAEMHMICNGETIVAEITNTERFWPECKDNNYANGEYIVKACNAYPKLVEALRLCNRVLLQTQQDDYVADAVTAATNALRASGEEL